MKEKLILIILLFIASCSSEEGEEATDESATQAVAVSQTSAPVEPEIVAKEVDGIVVKESVFMIPVNTVGNVKATKRGKITSEVSGIFEFDYVFQGREFKKGEVIGRVKDFTFDSNYEKQKAAFERKYIDFLQSDVIPQEYKDKKYYELLKMIDSDKNPNISGRARTTGLYEELLNFKALDIERRKRTIRAPDNIIISTVNVENGQNVTKGTSLFDYIFNRDKVIEVSLFENEAAYLNIGDVAEIKRQSLVSSSPFQADVIGISKQISQDRFRLVTLRLQDSEELIDGEQVDVAIAINTRRIGIQVPNEAIVYRDQKPVIFEVDNGNALWKYVEVGDRFGNMIEIRDGISVGSKIITKGHFTLAHQAPVIFNQTN